MFGFFGSKGEQKDIRFDDVLGVLEELEEDIEIDMSYRAGRNRETYQDLPPEQVKDHLRNRLSPAREFSYGERYDSVNSLMGAVSTTAEIPEGLYTDAVHTVTENSETIHHTLEITQGFLYPGQSHEESVKGSVLRQAEISYELPRDPD